MIFAVVVVVIVVFFFQQALKPCKMPDDQCGIESRSSGTFSRRQDCLCGRVTLRMAGLNEHRSDHGRLTGQRKKRSICTTVSARLSRLVSLLFDETDEMLSIMTRPVRLDGTRYYHLAGSVEGKGTELIHPVLRS